MYQKIDGTKLDDAEVLDLVMPMYNLIEYSSNYCETTVSLWFYSNNEVNDFHNNIANTNYFKSFKYKPILLGNTVAQRNPNQPNGILKNATIAVPLKHLSNFWRSLEMPFVNCKIELKFKWANYCVLSAAGKENVTNNDSDNIIFTVKDPKLYVPIVTLSARDNQKLSKLLSKGFKRSVYWNEFETKSENKNTTNEYGYFLGSNVFGGNWFLFALVYLNQDANAKRFNARKYHLTKGGKKLWCDHQWKKTCMTKQLIST